MKRMSMSTSSPRSDSDFSFSRAWVVLSFEASTHAGETVVVDRAYVAERVAEIAANDDLSKFIL